MKYLSASSAWSPSRCSPRWWSRPPRCRTRSSEPSSGSSRAPCCRSSLAQTRTQAATLSWVSGQHGLGQEQVQGDPWHERDGRSHGSPCGSPCGCSRGPPPPQPRVVPQRRPQLPSCHSQRARGPGRGGGLRRAPARPLPPGGGFGQPPRRCGEPPVRGDFVTWCSFSLSASSPL